MKPRYSDRQAAPGKAARENRHVQPVEKTRPSLDEDGLMAIISQHEVPFVRVLDCVQDPHNLGAILRTADAAGVHAVVAPKDKAVGITETVRRISVGEVSLAHDIPKSAITPHAPALQRVVVGFFRTIAHRKMIPFRHRSDLRKYFFTSAGGGGANNSA
jgi:23S rRNA (guanosine2251-2'-O)-methyltransferase